MTDFILKMFIKDYKNIHDNKVRAAYGILASILGIICNIFLFLIKLVIGMLINSISVMADAFNNLSDASSSIVSFIGIKLAEKPADKEHPFGHGRIEYIAAFIVSFLIIFVGISLFKSSFDKILHPEAINFNLISILILSISILVKIGLSYFNKKLGNIINSSIMKATAADAFNDVIVTLVTIFSVVISNLSGLNVDGYLGVCVSIFVLYSGINIAKDTLFPLIGEAIDKDIYDKIVEKVESYDGILGSHDLIIHNYGVYNIIATIHAEVPNNSNIVEVHEIIDLIERDILKEMNINLVIHMDPIEVENEKVLINKRILLDVIENIDKNISIHDFRVILNEDIIKMIFDIVIPYTYNKNQEIDVLRRINEELRNIYNKYECIINVDKSYVKQ